MVEIRGVEPLTFSMPFSDGAEDGKDGRGFSPVFAAFAASRFYAYLRQSCPVL